MQNQQQQQQQQKQHSVTFSVNDVKVEEILLPTINSPPKSLPNLEAFSTTEHPRIKANEDVNGFIIALHFAFGQHYPLVLKPDHIWFLIINAFSIHINKNSEKYRHLFVNHQDKVNILVIDDSLVLGSKTNDWNHVFQTFEKQIFQMVHEDVPELFTANYSTTTDVEKVCYTVACMDTLQSYFTYELLTRCGIPEITLLGTTEDWISIKEKIKKFEKFELGWWIQELNPILDEFIFASQSRPNKSFWETIYKLRNGSGGPYVTGWINSFFPYLWSKQGYIDNKYVLASERKKMQSSFGGGPRPTQFPKGTSIVPFVWTYLDQSLEMNFISGFIEPTQNQKTFDISPQLGWAIQHVIEESKEEKEKKMKRRRSIDSL